jgi:hypothetical protein
VARGEAVAGTEMGDMVGVCVVWREEEGDPPRPLPPLMFPWNSTSNPPAV